VKRVAIDDVDVVTNPMGVHDVRKPVSRVLGTEHVAMNYFELAPGDAFAGGVHAHGDQEEVFYVLSGPPRSRWARSASASTSRRAN